MPEDIAQSLKIKLVKGKYNYYQALIIKNKWKRETWTTGLTKAFKEFKAEEPSNDEPYDEDVPF
jgi:hypothetical protein